MNEYTTIFYEVLKVAADISILRLLFLMGFVLFCILAWQSPHLLKTYLEYKKSIHNEAN